MKNFDAIIIGSGQAGNPLAKRLLKEGMKVAMVESSYVGGTCINFGCTPTKTLIGISKTLKEAVKSSKYNVKVDLNTLDYNKVYKRKNDVVKYYREKLFKTLNRNENLTFFEGKATFTGYKVLKINQDTNLTAPLIFINTGAQPAIPKIIGLESVPYLSSNTILDIEYLPKHLIIVGGGYIALEFAQAFRRMGSLISIVERSPILLPNEDEDVSTTIQKILEDEGIQIYTKSSIERVFINSEKLKCLEITTDNNNRIILGTDILIATGRKPNTEDLNLSNTNVLIDDRGYISVNENLETNVKGIFALGDVKGGPAFTHVAYNDYTLISKSLFENENISIQDRLVPYCLFIDPELGRIGITERQAAIDQLDYSIAKMKTSAIARAVEIDEINGFIKAVIDNKTKKILGVTTLCPNGGELMSLFQIAMTGGLTFEVLRDIMFAHPTFAESLNNLFHPSNIK